MAISFSRPDPSSPAAVSAAVFTTARRGYDQTEVRDFLRMVSAELARLQERERFLESELKAMQTRGMSAPGMLDEEMVTALLGEEAARVLATAREASAQIRVRAEEAATRLVKEASADAMRLREEAELEAVRRREDAAADAEAEVEMAKQQGREMVNEAREYREKVLAELARRRELARAQIEQLIHNRDRLLNAFERARLATDDVMTGLVSVDEDLPQEYVNLAPTTGPVQPVVLDPSAMTGPTTVVPMFDRELEPEDDLPVRPVDFDVVADESPVEDDIVVVEEAVEAEPVALVVEETIAVVEIDEVSDTIEHDVTAIEEVVVTDTVVAVDTVEEEAPVAETVVDAALIVEEAPSNVVSLFGKDRNRPEPVVVNPEHPSVDNGPDGELDKELDNSEVRPELVAETQAPTPRDSVGDLFARLRESTVKKVAEATTTGETVVNSRKKVSESKSARPAPAAVEPVRDDAAFARRAEALAPLVISMARKLKRVLADEENEALEYLRGKKAVLSLDAMYGDAAGHVAKYADAISSDILAAANAAASRKCKNDEILPVITAMIEAQLVAPMREKLAETLAKHDDRGEAAKAIRGIYRQWKTTTIDEHIDDIACLSYSRGMYVTLSPGTKVCWMVDPDGPECADAEDNSLAGAIACGDEFPTGHSHPLAHEGCRCLLAPAPK
jgi:DivIVA domain-containing protein